MDKVLILGSGPAGTWAAFQLAKRNIKCVVIDIGAEPPANTSTNTSSSSSARPSLAQNFYDLKRTARLSPEVFLGQNHEALHNVFNPYLSPKLKSPLMRYIFESGNVSSLGNIFQGINSKAKGGLANAWGGHVYRFNDHELNEFSFTYKDLKPYYDQIAGEISIAGQAHDDLSRFNPDEPSVGFPIKLDQLGQKMLERYAQNKNTLNQNGVYLGRPRIAIENSKNEYTYHNMDFFLPTQGDLYSPRFTMDKLIAEGMVEYRPGLKAIKFSENLHGITVTTKNIKSNQTTEIQGSKLLVACGVLNTTKIVLNSTQQFNVRRPFLDNAIQYIPFVHLPLLGKPQEQKTYNAQLNLVFNPPDSKNTFFGTFYNFNPIMRSDVIFDFPLPYAGAVWGGRNVLQAMTVLQLWHPGQASPNNYISLDQTDQLHINYDHPQDNSAAKHVIKVMRRLGFLSHPILIKNIDPGSSYHYAGPFPMKRHPTDLETDTLGRLHGFKNIHIIDSSIFPTLPSKNLTFTIMANASRIADNISL